MISKKKTPGPPRRDFKVCDSKKTKTAGAVVLRLEVLSSRRLVSQVVRCQVSSAAAFLVPYMVLGRPPYDLTFCKDVQHYNGRFAKFHRVRRGARLIKINRGNDSSFPQNFVFHCLAARRSVCLGPIGSGLFGLCSVCRAIKFVLRPQLPRTLKETEWTGLQFSREFSDRIPVICQATTGTTW